MEGCVGADADKGGVGGVAGGGAGDACGGGGGAAAAAAEDCQLNPRQIALLHIYHGFLLRTSCAREALAEPERLPRLKRLCGLETR